jgi:hypothetical protein
MKVGALCVYSGDDAPPRQHIRYRLLSLDTLSDASTYPHRRLSLTTSESKVHGLGDGWGIVVTASDGSIGTGASSSWIVYAVRTTISPVERPTAVTSYCDKGRMQWAGYRDAVWDFDAR